MDYTFFIHVVHDLIMKYNTYFNTFNNVLHTLSLILSSNLVVDDWYSLWKSQKIQEQGCY